uniref:Ribosomal protein L5 n=1 Tax=Cafileria marina TaxID=2557541 RepID=A0A5B9IKT8_9STRA|nr:ribosomal protein L5 [Cafileria marina]QEF30248.1 ribosomal protein L5 [Cafileria marina]
MYLRLHEKQIYINDILYITKFFKDNKESKIPLLKKIKVNLSFKNIAFNKKRITPLLIILETLFSQYTYLQKSHKSILNLNIKKNDFVSCKIDLNKNNMYNFLDTLITYLPSLEKNKYIFLKNIKYNILNDYNIKLNNIYKFNQLKNLQNVLIQDINISIYFETFFYQEKIFLLSSLNQKLLKNINA